MTMLKNSLLLFLLLASVGCAAAPARVPTGGLAAEALAFHAPAAAGPPVEARGLGLAAGVRLERVLGQYDLRHERVVAAEILPDGRTLVSLGARGDLLRWDVVSRTLLG